MYYRTSAYRVVKNLMMLLKLLTFKRPKNKYT